MSDEQDLYDVEVEVSLSVTINTGNFENIKPEYRVKAKVRDGVHPDEAKTRLEARVDAWMEDYLTRLKAEKRKLGG